MHRSLFCGSWRGIVPCAHLLFVLIWVAALLPTPATLHAEALNLLSNPGFESGAASWNLCGNATIVNRLSSGITPLMVLSGQRALRLMSTENGCGSPVFDPYAAARQQLFIPADAADLTISFWYSRVGNPTWPLKVSLAEPGGYGYLGEVDVENLAGWQLFRLELTLPQLERVRGRTVELRLGLEFSTNSANLPPEVQQPGFYVDDLRVVPAIERTLESPRPADLVSDGTRPIVFLDAALGGLARMNADGSSAQPLYRGSSTPLSPAWSSGGDRVAWIEGALTPEDTTDIRVNNAFISIINVLGIHGRPVREIVRTSGLAGFRPTVPTASDPERPALDVTASSIDWSPDDQTIAVALCASNRYKNGRTSDPSCWVELFAVASGASLGKLTPGFAPSWSSTNRLLLSNQDSFQSPALGLYEADLASSPLTAQLLVAGTGTQFAPSFTADRSPSWSPDGTRFATVRKVDGFHYDEQGRMVSHYAIMLFQRDQLIGRQILLADQGDEPSSLTWSPDGVFLLYTLYLGGGADIWWLDTRSGATGRLTTNGSSAAANWRAHCPISGCQDSQTHVFLPAVWR